MILHQQLDYWPRGRTWVVSDVHGCLEVLQRELQHAGYTPEQDRLVCLGDLIDRGPDSYRTVRFVLSQPNAHVVLGNHEQFFLNSIDSQGVFLEDEDPFVWFINGGSWAATMDPPERSELWHDFNQFPLCLTITRHDGSQIGICHAEPPTDHWDDLETLLCEPSLRQRCLWGRQKIGGRDCMDDRVKGVDWTVHGHTIVPGFQRVGNSLFVDLGSFATGRIAVIDIEDLEHLKCQSS